MFFMPALLIGIGFPTYIGYYRGGIRLGSTVCAINERARGWIYLLAGLYGYMYPLVAYLVLRIVPSAYHIYAIFGVVALGAFPRLLARRIGSGVLSLFEEKSSSRDIEIFISTGWGPGIC